MCSLKKSLICHYLQVNGYMGLQGVAGGYRWLYGVTVGYILLS